MPTKFGVFILKFNEMALILIQVPIIFMVSSFDSSPGNRNVEYQFNGNDVIFRPQMSNGF